MISEDQIREQTESHYPEQDVSEEECSQRFIRFLVSDHRGQGVGLPGEAVARHIGIAPLTVEQIGVTSTDWHGEPCEDGVSFHSIKAQLRQSNRDSGAGNRF